MIQFTIGKRLGIQESKNSRIQEFKNSDFRSETAASYFAF